ncbi:hypothetical protein BDA96_01G160700 [Sorghum bicolor]|uniref:Uncharacterized protein n=2 Tax=Sorghum bicolor TaxID=4558 RepID=A0A921UYS4_SORBI|nr:uncharacterized protein LOC8062194 [Sorghum bicolor]KAG0548365.1 hypothetical protein BDA96_01G160700 [Sorghum bicolor]KXG37931.1 hypothetical protein SORBI_3001G152800 [Sorghum bicolor]|eukprot:XP_021312899.1 uncharacterized protein LOC8062194 [Sorghum bicolor]
MAAVQSNRAHPHRRSEASSPATSVAVAAARADDAQRQRRPRVPVQVREQGPLAVGHHHPHHQLRRSAAFPPRRPGAVPAVRRPPQRCDSDLNIREHRTCSEVAGGTAAGCAAVCCCFPCVMVEVVVLATVRAPAALCRKAARVRKAGRRRSASAGQATEIYELLVDDAAVVEVDATGAADAAVALPVVKPALELEDTGELEKEVWARFYGTGFWRSPSQLDDLDDDSS